MRITPHSAGLIVAAAAAATAVATAASATSAAAPAPPPFALLATVVNFSASTTFGETHHHHTHTAGSGSARARTLSDHDPTDEVVDEVDDIDDVEVDGIEVTEIVYKVEGDDKEYIDYDYGNTTTTTTTATAIVPYVSEYAELDQGHHHEGFHECTVEMIGSSDSDTDDTHTPPCDTTTHTLYNLTFVTDTSPKDTMVTLWDYTDKEKKFFKYGASKSKNNKKLYALNATTVYHIVGCIPCGHSYHTIFKDMAQNGFTEYPADYDGIKGMHLELNGKLEWQNTGDFSNMTYFSMLDYCEEEVAEVLLSEVLPYDNVNVDEPYGTTATPTAYGQEEDGTSSTVPVPVPPAYDDSDKNENDMFANDSAYSTAIPAYGQNEDDTKKDSTAESSGTTPAYDGTAPAYDSDSDSSSGETDENVHVPVDESYGTKPGDRPTTDLTYASSSSSPKKPDSSLGYNSTSGEGTVYNPSEYNGDGDSDTRDDGDKTGTTGADGDTTKPVDHRPTTGTTYTSSSPKKPDSSLLGYTSTYPSEYNGDSNTQDGENTGTGADGDTKPVDRPTDSTYTSSPKKPADGDADAYNGTDESESEEFDGTYTNNYEHNTPDDPYADEGRIHVPSSGKSHTSPEKEYVYDESDYGDGGEGEDSGYGDAGVGADENGYGEEEGFEFGVAEDVLLPDSPTLQICPATTAEDNMVLVVVPNKETTQANENAKNTEANQFVLIFQYAMNYASIKADGSYSGPSSESKPDFEQDIAQVERRLDDFLSLLLCPTIPSEPYGDGIGDGAGAYGGDLTIAPTAAESNAMPSASAKRDYLFGKPGSGGGDRRRHLLLQDNEPEPDNYENAPSVNAPSIVVATDSGPMDDINQDKRKFHNSFQQSSSSSNT
jgi:hypothetical protein